MSRIEHPADERSLKRRLRHRRRDLLWHTKLRLGRGYGRRDINVSPDPACPELAIGAVAMGAQYADWCLTMLTSLRERGAFTGPVYIITDRPQLFRDFDNLVIVSVPPTRHRLIAKACKQVLMHYVDEPVFLYLDADLVVTRPIVDWYRQMKPALERSPVLCYEDVKPVPGAFHGGVVLVDRVRGGDIIRRWQRAVRSGRYGSDQACLYSVAGRDGPGHLPERGFMFLSENLDADPPQDIECIVHVTTGVIRASRPESLTRFMRERLGVSRIPRFFD